MVRRLAFPATPPPQWYGLVRWGGRGGGRVRIGMELLPLDGGVGAGAARDHTQALRKP